MEAIVRVNENTRRILEERRKKGRPFKIVRARMDPKAGRQISKFTQSIEEKHRRAAKSKLHFGKGGGP